jgi:hypothetical protein
MTTDGSDDCSLLGMGKPSGPCKALRTRRQAFLGGAAFLCGAKGGMDINRETGRCGHCSHAKKGFSQPFS